MTEQQKNFAWVCICKLIALDELMSGANTKGNASTRLSGAVSTILNFEVKDIKAPFDGLIFEQGEKLIEGIEKYLLDEEKRYFKLVKDKEVG